MANLYHWINGNNTDQVNSVDLIAYGEAASIANSSRWYGGANNAFRIGHTAGGRAVEYTAYGAVDALENVGTGDFTVMFWWKPNDSSFGTQATRHHFISSPDVVKIVNYAPQGNTASNYDLRAYYRYGAGTQTSKAFKIDLTGNPWIRVYFSRIAGVFTYVLYDASGNILNDKSGNPCYFVNAAQAGNIYDSTNADPHIRIGGNFAYGKSAGGFYDDIIWSQGHGIAYDSIETHADGYHVVNPVINSFSSDVASVDSSGDSVTFSWDSVLGTTLSLYNQNTHETIDVSGLSSKSVAITGTVSYLLIAQNAFGQTTSAPVTITLNGGANMPFISDDSNNPGLVLQYKMLNESTELAQVVRVLNPKDGSDVSLNEAFEQALAARGLLSDALTAEIAARGADVTATEDARVAGDAANDAALVAATSEMDTALNTLSAARASKDSDQSAAIAAEGVTMNALVSSLATARAAADTALNSSIDDAIALRVSMMADASDARIAGDAAADLALSNEVSAENTSLATEVSAREDGDDLLNANLTAEINARVADVAAKVQARQDGDSDAQASLASEVSAYEAARDAEIAARGAADSALSVKLANAEGDRISAISAEASARDAADVLRTSELAAAVSGREAAMVSAIAARVAGDANVQSLIDAENVARVADLAASSTERANKDVALTDELDVAIAARISAVNAETALREADFVSISDDLAAEVTARGLALNTLASDRASGDGVQSAAMNTQAGLRVSEMAAENTAMSDKDTLIASAITDEAVARAAGDANVSTKLKVLTDRLAFSGDSAGGGSLVLADPAAGVAPVTAKFEKVNATLVKLFLS